MRQIDSYSHNLPRVCFDRMAELAEDKGAIKRWLTIAVLYDLGARLKMMEGFPGYQQILTPSNPPVEMIAGPDDSLGMARLANDGRAEIRDRHPEKFSCFRSPAAHEQCTRSA